jgi:phosphatidylglycerol:prolipoprotein diacylglycerol transferase
MRQTLFRIALREPWVFWKTDETSGLPLVGVGFVLVAAACLWMGYRLLANRGRLGEKPGGTLLAWLGALVVISIPAIAQRMPLASVPLFGYGFMLLIGFVSALWFARRQAVRAGFDPDLLYDLAFWLLISGIAGGRLAYLLQYGEHVFTGPRGEPLVGRDLIVAAVNLSQGGLVLIGAIFGGAVGFFAFCRKRKINALALADVIVPSIFIGIGFGRLGCLLNGCCFGDACSLPWAITFPNGSVPFQVLAERGFVDPAAATTMPLHPTQIYSSLDGFILATVTALYFRARHRPGEVLALACILCAITRFFIEFLRNDEMGQLGTRLTISQFYSLGILAAGLGLLVYLQVKQRRDPVRPAEAPIAAADVRV